MSLSCLHSAPIQILGADCQFFCTVNTRTSIKPEFQDLTRIPIHFAGTELKVLDMSALYHQPGFISYLLF